AKVRSSTVIATLRTNRARLGLSAFQRERSGRRDWGILRGRREIACSSSPVAEGARRSCTPLSIRGRGPSPEELKGALRGALLGPPRSPEAGRTGAVRETSGVGSSSLT